MKQKLNLKDKIDPSFKILHNGSFIQGFYLQGFLRSAIQQSKLKTFLFKKVYDI